MGTDFLRDKRQRHTKAWREDMNDASFDLLADVSRLTRIVRARATTPTALVLDQHLTLRLLEGGEVVASDGIHAVASVINPSMALRQQLSDSNGICLAEVRKISESGRIELLIENWHATRQ